MDTIESLCNQLARSKLLAPEAVRTIRNRWLAESKDDIELAHFSAWLVTNGFITDFQLGVLQRGFAELLFLDDYKLLERIGQGRMAGVYKAVHKLGQVVAVKVLPRAKGKDPSMAARFQREALMALRLQHPNCVRTFQMATTQNGLQYIVMEYLDGNTLDDVLKSRGKLPLAEAVHVLTQALRGLNHIESAALVHRDLKPANLMLVPAAVETVTHSQVKILDIGLGRPLVGEGETDELTTEGIVLGTPLYMAPEQARSSHAADIRSDLYSLGCVLYHAVTGQPPFPDNNAMVQILRHASELPRPLKEMAPDLPPALQTVMDQFLAKDPAQRFVSSTQAMKALAPFGPPIPALIRANAPMPAYVKWLEQQEGPENQPSAPTPPKTQPTSPAAVPFAKPLTPMFPTPVARPPTTAELARRRSLAAALAVVVLAILGGLLWAGWYFFPSP